MVELFIFCIFIYIYLIIAAVGIVSVLLSAVCRVLTYVFPLLLAAILVITGMGFANSLTAGAHDRYVAEKQEEYAHTVTIIWDEATIKYTQITVREDANWDINGVVSKSDILFPEAKRTTVRVHTPKLPEEAEKNGYTFLGLYDAPYGGTQYVNAAGYSLLTPEHSMILYAVWEVN